MAIITSSKHHGEAALGCTYPFAEKQHRYNVLATSGADNYKDTCRKGGGYEINNLLL
jgi:hypothetical protein